jgi:hypothetical protein
MITYLLANVSESYADRGSSEVYHFYFFPSARSPRKLRMSTRGDARLQPKEVIPNICHSGKWQTQNSRNIWPVQFVGAALQARYHVLVSKRYLFTAVQVSPHKTCRWFLLSLSEQPCFTAPIPGWHGHARANRKMIGGAYRHPDSRGKNALGSASHSLVSPADMIGGYCLRKDI